MAIIAGQKINRHPFYEKLKQALDDSITLAEFDLKYAKIKPTTPRQRQWKAEFYEAAIVKFGDDLGIII